MNKTFSTAELPLADQELLEYSLDLPPSETSPVSQNHAILGTLVGFDESGYPLVEIPGISNFYPVAARSLVPLDRQAKNLEVALICENGDWQRPLILGAVQPPNPEVKSTDPMIGDAVPSAAAAVQCQLDDDRLVLSAEREIVLQCGSASITLTRAGKVLIRGTYVLSRSSGANRIKGGSVQIN